MNAVVALAAAPLLAVIAVEDLRHHRIRNRHVVALAAVVVGTVAIAAVGGDSGVAGRVALGAVLGSAPLAAVWLMRPASIGGGDVKLAAALSALVGAMHPWLAVAAVGLGLAGSLATALATRRAQGVALGPAMAAGTFVVMITFVMT